MRGRQRGFPRHVDHEDIIARRVESLAVYRSALRYKRRGKVMLSGFRAAEDAMPLIVRRLCVPLMNIQDSAWIRSPRRDLDQERRIVNISIMARAIIKRL
jgi:hypothetical protein